MSIFYVVIAIFVFLAFVGIVLGLLPPLPDTFLNSIGWASGYVKGWIVWIDGSGAGPIFSRLTFVLACLAVYFLFTLGVSIMKLIRGNSQG